MAEHYVWGHDGCDSYYQLELTSCPRHRGTPIRRMTMPKITRFGGHSNAGLTDRDAGFVENTGAIKAQAAARTEPVALDDEEENEEATGRDLFPEDPEPPFNPTELSVADVKQLLADCTDDEREAVIAAERAGKNRTGITG